MRDDGRYDIEFFRDILANPLQVGAATADLFLFGDIVDYLDPGQSLWQRLPARLLP